MKKMYLFFMMMVMAAGGGIVRAQQIAVGHADVAMEDHASMIPTPINTHWASGMMIAVLWLFIAAILLGPIVLWLRGPEKPERVAGHH